MRATIQEQALKRVPDKDESEIRWSRAHGADNLECVTKIIVEGRIYLKKWQFYYLKLLILSQRAHEECGSVLSAPADSCQSDTSMTSQSCRLHVSNVVFRQQQEVEVTTRLTVNVGPVSATRQARISASLICSITWASYAIMVDTSSIISPKHVAPGAAETNRRLGRWSLQIQSGLKDEAGLFPKLQSGNSLSPPDTRKCCLQSKGEQQSCPVQQAVSGFTTTQRGSVFER